MEEILKRYKLASTGDLSAIKFLIENMGEGKLLKTNCSSLLHWYTLLGKENDLEAYNILFSPIDYNVSESVVIEYHHEDAYKKELLEIEALEKEKQEALKKDTSKNE